PYDPQLRELAVKESAKLAGPHFDTMASSYENTIQYLNNPDPRLRLAALKMSSFYWRRPPGFALLCERVAVEDPDLDVREMAVLSLGASYRGTYDPRIGSLLAGVVHDEKLSAKCRRSAYQALFSLREKLFPNFFSFLFPEDVDWAFVDSF